MDVVLVSHAKVAVCFLLLISIMIFMMFNVFGIQLGKK